MYGSRDWQSDLRNTNFEISHPRGGVQQDFGGRSWSLGGNSRLPIQV